MHGPTIIIIIIIISAPHSYDLIATTTLHMSDCDSPVAAAD